MGKQWKQCETLCFWAPKSLHMVTAAMKLKDPYSLEGSYGQPRGHIKKQRHYFVNKGPSKKKTKQNKTKTKVRLVKAMVFPVVMCGCESWSIKNAERQRIEAFELWSLLYHHNLKSSILQCSAFFMFTSHICT